MRPRSSIMPEVLYTFTNNQQSDEIYDAPYLGNSQQRTQQKLIKWRESLSEQRLRISRQVISDKNDMKVISSQTQIKMHANFLGEQMNRQDVVLLRKFRAQTANSMQVKPCVARKVLRDLVGEEKAKNLNKKRDYRSMSNETINSDKKRVRIDQSAKLNYAGDDKGINTPSHSFAGSQSHRSKLSRPNRNGANSTQASKDKIDGKKVVKMANFYFQNHPTCLKRLSDSEDSDESRGRNGVKGKKQGGYAKIFIDSTSSEGSRKPKKYNVKNPYHEDRDCYNLDACIQQRRKPNFGFPMPDLELPLVEQEETKLGFEFDFLLPSVIAMKREKQFMEHVYKCFTFGKPVRRLDPQINDNVSRIDEIKSKFNRVSLIRKYFSIKRRNKARKFDYPIDQFGRIVTEKGQNQDYQQYCIESDFEHEYPRRNKAQERQVLQEVSQLKFQQLGIQSAHYNPFSQPGINNYQSGKISNTENSLYSPFKIDVPQGETFSKPNLVPQTAQPHTKRKAYDLQDNRLQGLTPDPESRRSGNLNHPPILYHQEYGEIGISASQSKTNSGQTSKRNNSIAKGTQAIINSQVNLFKREEHQGFKTGQSEALLVSDLDRLNGSSGYFGSQKSPQEAQSTDKQSKSMQKVSSQRVSFQKGLVATEPSEPAIAEVKSQPRILSLYELSKKTMSITSSEKHVSDSSSYKGKGKRNRRVSKRSKKKSRNKSRIVSSALTHSSANRSPVHRTTESIGYFSDKEFDHVKSDLAKSYCSSLADLHDQDLIGKDHLFQPYDFFTQRRTKRFFHEDFVNLTKAAVDKEYINRQYLKEVDTNLPNVHQKLKASEIAYNEYLAKQRSTSHTIQSSGSESGGDRYAQVRPYSPSWKELKNKHKQPEQIKLMIEASLTKEIPENSREHRKANNIPIKHEIDKNKIRKEYHKYMGKATTESSDSEYEQMNLKNYLTKKKNKGEASMTVLEQVEKRLKKKKNQSVLQYGQRSQHMQVRDDQNRIESINFLRSQQQKNLTEKRHRLQKMQQFKQGLTNDQMQVLKDRQFVIVDQAQLRGKKRQNDLMHREEQQKKLQKALIQNSNTVSRSDLQARSRTPSIEKVIDKPSTLKSKGTVSKKRGNLLDCSDEKTRENMVKRETRELDELKEDLATMAETEKMKTLLKNAEFNRDVRRKYNRYKREMREKLQRQQEEKELFIEHQIKLQEEHQQHQQFQLQKLKDSQILSNVNTESDNNFDLQQLPHEMSRDTIMTSDQAYGGTTASVMNQSLTNIKDSSMLNLTKPVQGYNSMVQFYDHSSKQHQSTQLLQKNNNHLAQSSNVSTNDELTTQLQDNRGKAVVSNISLTEAGVGEGYDSSAQKTTTALSYLTAQKITNVKVDLISAKMRNNSHSQQETMVNHALKLNSQSQSQNNTNSQLASHAQTGREEKSGSNTKALGTERALQQPGLSSMVKQKQPVFVQNIVINQDITSATPIKRVQKSSQQQSASLISKQGGSVARINNMQRIQTDEQFDAYTSGVNESQITMSRRRSMQSHSKISSHRSKISATSASQEAYRHIPSDLLSPIGDMINLALQDVPKMPKTMDRRYSEVIGINQDKRANKKQQQLTGLSGEKKGTLFSKFMLERLKKHSILNHDVFKNNDVDFKKKVATNYSKYQAIIRKGGKNNPNQH